MPTPAATQLVLSDGGPLGLLAAARASEDAVRAEGAGSLSPKPLLWGVSAEALPLDALGEATARQAGMFGLDLVTLASPADPFAGRPTAETEALLLVRAVHVAAELGCRRVVWPVQAPAAGGMQVGGPPDPAEVGRKVDRALLASRMVLLEIDRYPVPDVEVELPFVDMTDAQVADLLDDFGLTLESCWWWGGAAAETERGRAERHRWTGALAALHA